MASRTFVTDGLSLSKKNYANEVSFANKHLKLENAEDCNEICEKISLANHMKVLRLEGNSLGVDAARSIGNALREHKSLERLILNDIFTSRLVNEVPPALDKLFSGIMDSVHLVELNLSDNAFGPRAMTSIAAVLTSPCCFSLKELRLHNNGLGIEGGKKLASALSELASVPGRFSLQVFICGRNRLENEGAIALAEAFSKTDTLEEIQMPQNGIHNSGLIALFHAFSKHPKLRMVNMNDNTMRSDGSEAISKIISKFTNLEHLNLGDCMLENEGATSLSLSLTNHSRLRELILSSNEIGYSGARKLLDNLKNVSSLKLVDLDCNRIGLEGIRSINQDCKNSTFDVSMRDDEHEDNFSDESENADEMNLNFSAADLAEKFKSSVSLNSEAQSQSESDTITGEPDTDEPVYCTKTHSRKYALHDRNISVAASAVGYHLPLDIQNRLVFKVIQESQKKISTEDVEMYICSLFDAAYLWDFEVPSRKELTEYIDESIGKLLNGAEENVYKAYGNSLLVALGLLKPENKKMNMPISKNRCEMLAYIIKQPYSKNVKPLVTDYILKKGISSRKASEFLIPLIK